MNKKQIKDRINYLKMELAHEGYHDGWVLKGLREELKKLEKEINER
tara:strand:+ start:647 stop:784 length:138 start_codon:yes stop_codon:yes gene_type:complete